MAKAFEDHGLDKDVQNMTGTGLVTRACFDHLASWNEGDGSCDKSQFSNDEIRDFLISFGLATPIVNISIDGQDCLYIPSLIEDNNRQCVMESFGDIQKNDVMSLGFLIKSPKSDEVHDIYSKLICRIIQDSQVTLHKGFAEKVENRRIGHISGMWGSLRTEDATGPHEFVIMETERNSMRPEDQRFARDKVM